MLGSYGHTKVFPAGARILQEGDAGDEMYVIQTGKARIYKGTDDRTVTLAVLSNGEFFGEMALVANHPRSASVEALEEITVSVIDRRTFESLLVSEPLVREIMRRMSDRIRTLDDSVFEMSERDSARWQHISGMIEHRNWLV